jgi:prevent-host-death family protein
MQTVSSGTVQSSFGAVIDIAKAGEPVTITQYGRPTLMLFSYSEGEALLKLRSSNQLHAWFEARRPHVTPQAQALTMDDVNDLVHELRP